MGKSNIQIKFSFLALFSLAFLSNCEGLFAQDQVDTGKANLEKSVEIVTDIDLDDSQQNSIINIAIPEAYYEFENKIYRDIGIKYKLSYQSAYQNSSASLTDFNSAWGGWFLFQFSWAAFNKDKDWEGRFIMSLDGRHTINPNSNRPPGLFKQDIGSLWATDGAYFNWDIYPAILMWQQTFAKDRFAIRLGQQQALTVLDFFRFADSRTSFSNTQIVLPVGLIPAGAPGLGLSFKWWPIDRSQLYVKGIVNDINAPAGKIDWSGIFETGDIFTGLEVGYNFLRTRNDFDHIHLTFWYADEVSRANWATKAGWGYKIHGSKQFDKIVGFANYAYNTSEGGGFNYTNISHAINVGTAYINPLKIEGEVAVGASWASPIEDGLRDQYGLEAYWKLLITPNFWITPGVHLLWDPTFNQETDFISIFQIKGRVFL